MNSIHSEFIFPKKVLNEFVTDNPKFEQRFVALLTDMDAFIKESNLQDDVKINELALGYMLLDYFEDIRRLKDFHHVEHINGIRVVAYTSYWLLRRKPIQLLGQKKEILYINERFVLTYILNFLSSTDKGEILLRSNKGIKSFSELLFYFLKYRFTSANALELVLTSFFAGQIYQETSRDISDELGRMNKRR